MTRAPAYAAGGPSRARAHIPRSPGAPSRAVGRVPGTAEGSCWSLVGSGWVLVPRGAPTAIRPTHTHPRSAGRAASCPAPMPGSPTLSSGLPRVVWGPQAPFPWGPGAQPAGQPTGCQAQEGAAQHHGPGAEAPQAGLADGRAGGLLNEASLCLCRHPRGGYKPGLGPRTVFCGFGELAPAPAGRT